MQYHIGKSIQKALDISGMKDADLARSLNVSPQQLYRWKQMPSVKTGVVENIASKVGMDFKRFLELGIDNEVPK